MLKKIWGLFITIKELEFQKKNELEECLFATNHQGAKFSELNLRYTGCAALDLAYVGAGRLDGFFQRKLNIWDIAAGIVILNEAGGRISPIDIEKIKNHSIIAASETIYKDLSNLLTNF